MRKFLLFVILLLFGFLLKAQDGPIITKETIEKQITEAAKLGPAGHTDEVIDLAQQAYENSEMIGYPEGMIRSGSLLMVTYSNSQDFNKVIETSLNVEKKALELKNYHLLSNAYRLRGLAYLQLGMTDSGEKEVFKSLEYAKKMDEGPGRNYRIAMIYDNLGELMSEKGVSEDSIMSYNLFNS